MYVQLNIFKNKTQTSKYETDRFIASTIQTNTLYRRYLHNENIKQINHLLALVAYY